MVRPFIFPALTVWGTRGTLVLRPFRAAAFFRCTDLAGCTNRVSVFAPNRREGFRLRAADIMLRTREVT